MKKRFIEEQTIGLLKQADAGMAIKELCRKHGFSDASFYLWRSKFGGMDVSTAAAEGIGAREWPAEAVAGRGDAGTRRRKKPCVVTAPAKRALVRMLQDKGMSEQWKSAYALNVFSC